MTSLSKICLHWTAGANTPCDTDLKAYHYCVDKNGKIFAGTHRPEDNLNCYDGNYAMHCGGGNTGCIGLSVCGMAGFTSDKKQTKYPLTQKQIEALCCLTAYLTVKYGILISEKSVFTHYEFDQRRAKQKREGKIDITYLHYLPHLSADSVGKYLRQKISWYRDKIKANKYKFLWDVIEPFVINLAEKNVPKYVTKLYENLAKVAQPAVDSLYKLKEKIKTSPNALDDYCFNQGVNAIESFAKHLLEAVEKLRA